MANGELHYLAVHVNYYLVTLKVGSDIDSCWIWKNVEINWCKLWWKIFSYKHIHVSVRTGRPANNLGPVVLMTFHRGDQLLVNKTHCQDINLIQTQIRAPVIQSNLGYESFKSYVTVSRTHSAHVRQVQVELQSQGGDLCLRNLPSILRLVLTLVRARSHTLRGDCLTGPKSDL